MLLTAEVQEEYKRRYGGDGDTAPVDAGEFHPPDGYFAVGYDGDVPVAMGGWRRHHGTEAELKRMYVREAARGRGHARTILTHLEQHARAAGVTRFVLETGLEQPEAIALYRSAGYEDVPSFGFYKDAPLSVHLGKDL